MNKIQNYKNELFNLNVKLDENDEALFDAESVARALGFTTVAKSGNAVIRWNRVNEYLGTTSGPKVERGSFISEPMVYKLAFKANNAIAEKFTDWLAIEVLPEIRRTGSYGVHAPRTMKEALQLALEQQEKIEEMQPKALFADSVATAKSSILVGELAKYLSQNGVEIGPNRLFKELRATGWLCNRKGEMWNVPTQKGIDRGFFEIKKRVINNPDGSSSVTRTPKVTGKGQIYFVNKFLAV